MLIYPAIDIYEGKCVRLRQGDFADQNVYYDSPLDIARSFRDAGLSSFHVVDLEGAKKGQVVNWSALSKILNLDGIQVQVGGGIRTRDDMTRLLAAGAARVVIGSLAVKSPHVVQEWMVEFRSERFVIAVDIRGGAVAHKGWLERANLTPSTLIETMARSGALHFLCTDIDRDGMLAGPNVELYRQLHIEFPSLRFIASGGVSRMEDLEDLHAAGCAGVVVGKALYEGRMKTEDLARYSGH